MESSFRKKAQLIAFNDHDNAIKEFLPIDCVDDLSSLEFYNRMLEQATRFVYTINVDPIIFKVFFVLAEKQDIEWVYWNEIFFQPTSHAYLSPVLISSNKIVKSLI